MPYLPIPCACILILHGQIVIKSVHQLPPLPFQTWVFSFLCHNLRFLGLNFLIYASARFKDLFSNFPFRPFPSADFFLKAGSAPTEFMSLFSRQIRTNERWNTKNFDREKCWEAKPSSLFFPKQRHRRNLFISTTHHTFAEEKRLPGRDRTSYKKGEAERGEKDGKE